MTNSTTDYEAATDCDFGPMEHTAAASRRSADLPGSRLGRWLRGFGFVGVEPPVESPSVASEADPSPQPRSRPGRAPAGRLNLALQGGGSHGAFTWGVLDALLADKRISLEGLSGTSAGAVNAVALASGYAKALAAGHDPRRAARDSLARIWGEISNWGALGAMQQRLVGLLWGGLPQELAPANIMATAWRSLLSPAQSNPLDINPLRSLLERE